MIGKAALPSYKCDFLYLFVAKLAGHMWPVLVI